MGPLERDSPGRRESQQIAAGVRPSTTGRLIGIVSLIVTGTAPDAFLVKPGRRSGSNARCPCLRTSCQQTGYEDTSGPRNTSFVIGAGCSTRLLKLPQRLFDAVQRRRRPKLGEQPLRFSQMRDGLRASFLGFTEQP